MKVRSQNKIVLECSLINKQRKKNSIGNRLNRRKMKMMKKRNKKTKRKNESNEIL